MVEGLGLKSETLWASRRIWTTRSLSTTSHTTEHAQKTYSMSKKKFTTIEAAEQIMRSMRVAINNMIDEVKKPVDPEINGSAPEQSLPPSSRRYRLQRATGGAQRLEQMIKDLQTNGGIEEAKDYTEVSLKDSLSDWKKIVWQYNKNRL